MTRILSRLHLAAPWAAAGVVVLLALAGILLRPDRSLEAASGDVGSISGVVTAEDSGQPLAGICVDAWGPEYSFDYTDNSGTYLIEGLPPGEYGVVFSDCHTWPPIYAKECYDDKRCGSQVVDLVLVGAGANVTDIDAALPLLGSISGVVTDESTGEPLEGICVSAASYLYDAGQTVTDSSGFYRIAGAYEEAYRVHFWDCAHFPRMYTEEYFDGAPDYSSANLVPVTWGTDTPDINASLQRVGSISGLVTDEATDEPLEGMCVTASGRTYRSVTTDSSGHFTIESLDTGDYTVVFGDCANQPALYLTEWYDNRSNCQPCESVHVAPGAAVADIDAALAEGGTISGTVTDEKTGATLYAVAVQVYDLAGELRQGAFTNNPGEYTIGPLPVGQYKVRFLHNYGGLPPHKTEWHLDKPGFQSADPVDVSAGAVTVVDAAMELALIHGDVGCNRTVTAVDALGILRFVAGLDVFQEPGCPLIGADTNPVWGDVDCSGAVNSVDALKILRWVAGLPVSQNNPCLYIGAPLGI